MDTICLFVLVDHRNDQWISENRLSSITTNEQPEMSNEQLNDSTNSLTGRKRARLKRRLNDVDSTDFSHETSLETTDQNTRKDYKPIVSFFSLKESIKYFRLSSSRSNILKRSGLVSMKWIVGIIRHFPKNTANNVYCISVNIV